MKPSSISLWPTVGTFATPSFELAMAVRLFRIALVGLVILFKLPGLLAGLAGVLLILLTTKSFGVPYLWPVIPFNFKALTDVIIRLPLPSKTVRPPVLKPLDPDRREPDEAREDKSGRREKKEIRVNHPL